MCIISTFLWKDKEAWRRPNKHEHLIGSNTDFSELHLAVVIINWKCTFWKIPFTIVTKLWKHRSERVQNTNGVSPSNSKINCLLTLCYLLVYAKEANGTNNWFYLTKAKQGLNKRKRKGDGEKESQIVCNSTLGFPFLMLEIVNY